MDRSNDLSRAGLFGIHLGTLPPTPGHAAGEDRGSPIDWIARISSNACFLARRDSGCISAERWWKSYRHLCGGRRRRKVDPADERSWRLLSDLVAGWPTDCVCAVFRQVVLYFYDSGIRRHGAALVPWSRSSRRRTVMVAGWKLDCIYRKPRERSDEGLDLRIVGCRFEHT